MSNNGTKTSTTKTINYGFPKKTSQNITGETSTCCEPRTIAMSPANYSSNRKYTRNTSKS